MAVWSRWLESVTRLGGFRALKNTLEALYTTKVNNRVHTSRGTTLTHTHTQYNQNNRHVIAKDLGAIYTVKSATHNWAASSALRYRPRYAAYFCFITFCLNSTPLSTLKSHALPEATGSPSMAPHWRSTSKTTTGAAAATLSEFLRPKVGISTQPCDACITRVSTPVSSLPGQGPR